MRHYYCCYSDFPNSVKPHSDFKTINEPNQIHLLNTYSIWIGFEMALIQLMISSTPKMGDGL